MPVHLLYLLWMKVFIATVPISPPITQGPAFLIRLEYQGSLSSSAALSAKSDTCFAVLTPCCSSLVSEKFDGSYSIAFRSLLLGPTKTKFFFAEPRPAG